MQAYHHSHNSREAVKKARDKRIIAIGKDRLKRGYEKLAEPVHDTAAELVSRHRAPYGRPRFQRIITPDEIPAALEAPYRINFPLKAERVSFDDIKSALAMNNNAEAQKKFGPFEVVCICVYDENPALGNKTTVVGGAIFTINDLRNSPAAPFTDVSVHLSYTFVTRPYRGLGINKRLMNGMTQDALRFVVGDGSTMPRRTMFLEQNLAPEMSLRDYFLDSRIGLSPLQREVYWGKKGFEQIDVDHVHPSTTEEGDLCHMLGVFVRGDSVKNGIIRSEIYLEHMRRDFGIWWPSDTRALAALIEQVQGRNHLPLLPPPTLDAITRVEGQILAAKKDVLQRLRSKPDELYESFERRPISDWLLSADALTKPDVVSSTRSAAALPAVGFRDNAL